MIEAGTALGIRRNTSTRLLDVQQRSVVNSASLLYEAFLADANDRTRAQPALQTTIAGEARCLRAIVYNVIKEMAERLA